MRARLLHFCLAVIVLAASRCAKLPPESPAGLRPRALVISIDGLTPRHYREAAALGVRIPNLESLIEAGLSADGVVGVLPTVTYPSHVTMMTGVKPNEHGIVSNKVFDPFESSDGAWYWFAKDIRVPTLVSAARAKGLRTATISWPAAVGIESDFNMPEFWRGASKHPFDVRLIEQLSTPGLLDAVGAARGRALQSFADQRDSDRVDVACWVIENHAPELVMVHLFDLDFAEHDQGPTAPLALSSLEQADAFVGRLLASLDKAGHRGDTLVAIVSDHGFVPVSTTVRPNVWLAEAGLIRLDAGGRVIDYRAIFHADGGSASLRLRDDNDREAVALVRSLIGKKLADPECGIERILDAEAARRLGGVGELVLDARDGFDFNGSPRGEWRTDSRGRGQHGYAPLRDSMHAGLVMAGPGIGHGNLGVVPMTSIAPTIARHLRVELSPLAGAPLELERRGAAR